MGILPIDELFMDTFAQLGLTQVVEEPTIYPSGNLLDLVLLSHAERLGDCVVLPLSWMLSLRSNYWLLLPGTGLR